MRSDRYKIKAAIFDMDGLMFDTERLSAEFWKQAGLEAGLLIGEEFMAGIRGSSKDEAEQRFYECYGTAYDYWSVRNRKTGLLRGYLDTHEVPVKKGLTQLLEYLRAHGYKIVLATSTAANYAFQYLDATGVRAYFDDFVCGDMVSRCKPDPEIFYRAAEKAGCEPCRCMVLEDSLNGITAAVTGGFIPVMVPDISEPTPELRKKLAARCESLLDVITFLEEQETDEKTHGI